MCIISLLFKKNRDKAKEKGRERNFACDELISQVNSSIESLEKMFQDTQNYIYPKKLDLWKEENASTIEALFNRNVIQHRKAERYQQLLKQRYQLLLKIDSLPQRAGEHNKRVEEARIQRAYALIGNVEGRKLDKQQIGCIIKEARNHLVIAGAGTGKTTTIVGKIKYLLKSGKYSPQDILVLSFTNASATEMCQRIQMETGEDIKAITFHKLGLNIISEVDGVMPQISQLNVRKFIKEQLHQEMQSVKYLNLLNSYMLYGRIMAKSEFEFQTEKAYNEYLTINPPTTIKNEVVKSYGEMDIANFLTQNNIRYIYEQPYFIDTRTGEYGQYYPDFYLPDYNIYIEYFGINVYGEVPAYFKGKNGKTASQTYQASMEWKRNLHRDNHTTMLECYAYQKMDGTLLENLEKQLKNASVVLSPQSPDELWKQVSAEGDYLLEGIIELFETLINLIKSNGYNIDMVRNLNKGGFYYRSNNLILQLLEPIFDSYCNMLEQENEIDFNDMINLAAQYIQKGKYTNPYQCVIVDEYQDISKARFNLLNSLRNSRNYELFCVGDDWQSIYRFAGSDINFILNFSQYWGASETSKIETTYRFSQKLIEISGGFIMLNPAQVKKYIRGKIDDFFPLGEINGYTEKYAIQFMAEKLNDLPKDSSVFFIGRYSFDVNILSDSGYFSCRYNNRDNLIDVSYNSRRDLKMKFLTAHKSKGLQADYVFIINNKKSKMGFPSKIQDAPILGLLLDNCEQFPFAEERRLFYVALTRAKKKVYLITIGNQESEFVMEMRNRYKEELGREKYTCPLCGGRLLKKTGPYGEFLGCSNYGKTGCDYKKKIKKVVK